MAIRIYIFEDKTRITVRGYLSPQKIYQAENEHGRLVCVTDGHIKIPCTDRNEFATL
jgi:hypothetical protein